ncbi:MAG TPA: hypothetical protein VFB41_05700 [Solirubrobacteraceae bacterium]|nr:hypothetical protein [Solirubrobacteraceae bacterium]
MPKPTIALHRPRRPTVLAVVLAASLAAPAAALAEPAKPWATINVCDTSARPDTIGLRALMPGNGTATDEMFMRFQVQYFSPADGAWHSLTSGGDSGFVDVGSGRQKTREAGRSFVFAPLAKRTGVQLRGLVSFEWRRGGVAIQKTRRLTTPKHVSSAGADPLGFSAAICVLV